MKPINLHWRSSPPSPIAARTWSPVSLCTKSQQRSTLKDSESKQSCGISTRPGPWDIPDSWAPVSGSRSVQSGERDWKIDEGTGKMRSSTRFGRSAKSTHEPIPRTIMPAYSELGTCYGKKHQRIRISNGFGCIIASVLQRQHGQTHRKTWISMDFQPRMQLFFVKMGKAPIRGRRFSQPVSQEVPASPQHRSKVWTLSQQASWPRRKDAEKNPPRPRDVSCHFPSPASGF